MKKNGKLLWSGDVNTATTTTASNVKGYTYYLVNYGSNNQSNGLGQIVKTGISTPLTIISVETEYKCTIYTRNITINSGSFTTTTGYYWRNNTTSSGNYCCIKEIYGLI